MLIYSVTSQQSFETVEFIRDKILNSIGNESIPMVLVGNKNDLTYQRQVETTQGQELAKKFNCKFLETSVRENINVEKAFETLIDEIENTESSNPKTTRKMYNNVMQKHPSFVEKYRSGVCWFVCEQECDCECECVYMCVCL